MTYQLIDIPQGIRYVSQWFEHDLPDDIYLDKTLCGCGATTFVLTNDVDYVVAIPFQSLGDNKLIQSKDNPEYPYELFVYHSGVDQVKNSLKAYVARVKERGHPLKVLVTYDSLPALESQLDLKSLKLFIDEGHKILEYAGNFKPRVIYDMLSYIPKFKNFIVVTATPTREEFLPPAFNDVSRVKLNWAEAYPVYFRHCRLYKNMVRNSIVALCLDYLRGKEGNLYIFVNSVTMVTGIIKDLAKFKYGAEDVKVICANTPQNKKTLKTLGNEWKPRQVIEEGDDKFYKINFVTSTAFEGQDFLDPLGKTVIISDSRLEHTKLDISTQVSQIIGRLRVSKFKDTVYMFWTDSPVLQYETEEDYRVYVEETSAQYQDAVEKFYDEDNPLVKKAIYSLSKGSPYLIEFEEEGTIIYNENAVNHLMNNYVGTTLQYFVGTDHPSTVEEKVTYTLRDVFVGQVQNSVKPPELAPEDRVVLGKRSNFNGRLKNYLNLLEMKGSTIDPRELEYIDTNIAQYESDPDNRTVLDYIEVFGLRDLKSTNLSTVREGTLDKKLTKHYKQEHLYFLLKATLKSGKTYLNEEIKAVIEELIDKHKLDLKPSISLIETAFFIKDVKVTVNGSRKNATTLLRARNAFNFK